MTRKDYRLIAGVFFYRNDMANRIQNTVARRNHYYELASSLATELQRDNPRFDRDKFLTACGWPTACLNVIVP